MFVEIGFVRQPGLGVSDLSLVQMNSCEGEVVSNAVSRSKSAFFLRENMGFTQKTGTERNDDNERNDDSDDDDERKVGFTKNTAMRHRRVGGRAVTVTAMLHRQKDREKKTMHIDI